MKKILIMGLPGSGKTYLSQKLHPLLNAAWYNADRVRSMANDWDFSKEGRIRQAKRMKTFAGFEKEQNRMVICDFVCPTVRTRKEFDPDIVVWMDTIAEGRYADTNEIFEKPENADFHIKEWKDDTQIEIAKKILKNV